MSMLLPKAAESHPVPTKDQFPTLVPRQFLQSPQDHKMNSSLSNSYSRITTKGVKTGSKYLKKICFLLGMRCGQCLRTGFLSRRMRKTYLPLLAFRATFPVNVPWKVVNEDDDVEMGQGRRNGRNTMGKWVLEWLTSIDEYSIDAPESIEFIDTYGHMDHMSKLKRVIELAQSRRQLVESRPTGISYKVKDKGKAKEVCQPTLKKTRSDWNNC